LLLDIFRLLEAKHILIIVISVMAAIPCNHSIEATASTLVHGTPLFSKLTSITPVLWWPRRIP
jgi:hypothetical protein